MRQLADLLLASRMRCARTASTAYLGSAIRADAPCGIERMMAGGAKVFKLLMAVRAQNVIGFDGITACATFAVFHELPLLERNFQLLLVTIDLQQWWTEQAIRNDSE